MTPEELIRRLDLVPHPEGGFFRETYRSPVEIPAGSLPAGYDAARPAATAIYYLLVPGTFSALHRLRGEELFHFYLGDPVEMLQLGEAGAGERLVLGPDLSAGMVPQVRVPPGVWQGSRLRPGGRYALLGTTMSPGFEYADFEFGDRAALLRAYPGFQDEILSLTRTG
jgi:predicted cupin superfamily sugar epimerase